MKLPLSRYSDIDTERINPRTANLDKLPLEAAIGAFDSESAAACAAVARARKSIAAASMLAAQAYLSGGRIIFAGAGTSGRLGVLEAAECPPTFGVPPSRIIAVMAGGRDAVFRSREGAEDDFSAGARDISRRARSGDCVIAIAASGVTPYALCALRGAKKRGAATVLVTCNPRAGGKIADVVAALKTGAEAVAGSTRMKAGTATKLALNSITTAAMLKSGKIYGNRMVDVRPVSRKLAARAIVMIADIGGVSGRRAAALLRQSGGETKTAIVMARLGLDSLQARALIKEKLFLRDIIG